MTDGHCPYRPLVERSFAIDEAAPEELRVLEDHVVVCLSCRELREEQQALERGLEAYGASLEGELQAGRAELRARIERAVSESGELASPRTLRRLQTRFVLYSTTLVAVGLLLIIWLGSLASLLTLRRSEAERFTRNELRALNVALRRYRAERGELPLGDGLTASLSSSSRRGPDRPYFRFDSERLDAPSYRDLWGQGYSYRPVGEGFVIYSFGADGRDDDRGGDDVWVRGLTP